MFHLDTYRRLIVRLINAKLFVSKIASNLVKNEHLGI